MASSEQLWFEMGVRDNVTNVLEKIKTKMEQIEAIMEDQLDMKPVYENALKIEDAYDKIAVAVRKIEQARSKTKDTDETSRLDKMKQKLDEIRKEFENISSNELAMGVKGNAALTATQQGLSLALAQTERYTKGIMDASKAEERHAQEELRRTDALKAKYNELERYRKQWNDVMSNLAPGTTLNGATRRMGQSLDYRFNQVAAALQGGGAMPSSATGADYEKFIRDLKEKIRELTAETDRYNNALARNASYYRSVNQAISDAVDQREVANIRGRRAEYDALERKIRDLVALSNALNNERNGLMAGTVTSPYYTQARVMEELHEIQGRYNIALARGQEQERRNAEAKRASAQATRELMQAQQGLVSAYDKVTQAGQRSNSTLQQLQYQMGTYFSLLGAERLIRNVIQIGGEFEVQHIALQSILGDIQQANSMFEQMKELAVVSPFNFRQLAQYSKQVAAFGVPYEEMYDTTKRLADMSAGLGVDMGRLILAYGQVRSAAVLRGQELRQFTEAGIPMVRALADEFTKLNGRAVSTAEVFSLISKRAVPFEMVKKVLWDMTNEGGRFYDMQYTLASTLAGKWSNLQDAWEIMLSDIAKGESLSGKMLKTMVQGLTSVIESVNTLSPLIAGVVAGYGMVRSAKWMSNFGNLGFNRIDQNVAAAQRLRAVELARQKINGEITREQYTQLMQMNANKGNYYKVLAMEGRLNTLQIQRAFKQGDINRKELAYLVQLRIITEEERKQILLGNLGVGIFNRLKLSAKSFFTTLNASLGPIGWIAIGLDAILTVAMTIGGKASEINQKNKDLAEGFANRANELADSVKSIQESTPTSEEDYRQGIEGLKEMLKQHSANYDAIMREASGLKTLKEQYEYLKGKLTETSEVYKKAEAMAADFGDKTRSDFEDIKELARETLKNNGAGRFGWSFDFDELQFRRNGDILLDRIKELADKIRVEIPNVGKSKEANSVFRQLRDSMLQELGVGSRESMMIKIRLNEILNISDGEGAADLVMPEFDKMISKLAPQIANKIRYGKTLEGAERKKVQDLVNDAIKTTGEKYPEYANYLQGLLNNSNFTATIRLHYQQDTAPNQLQQAVFSNMPQIATTSTTTAMNWTKSGNMYDAKNAAKKDIDDAYNNWRALKDSYDKGNKELKPLVESAKQTYDDYVNTAHTALNYDYTGTPQKSNKTPKTTKTDNLLKEAKRRIEEVKDFYAEYKKYRDQYGEKKGFDMVVDIFGMDRDKARNIVDNYKGVIEDVLKSVPLNTEERKKFAISLKKLLGDIQLDDLKNELSKKLKELERYIQDETSKWNLYKGLLEKTGNKDFAMQAFVDGIQWDDMTRNMSEKLREMLSKGGRNVDMSELFNMDETEAEKFLGKNTEEFKLWQEIVKDIRKNWTDSLNEVAAATEKLLTIEEKIAKTEQELAELRRKYGANDPRAIAKERDLGKLQVEAFEQSEPYLKFYSAIFAMAADEAEAVGMSIKENLVKQLAEGKINADKYLKSIKNIDQQLQKMRGVRSDALTLMTGGVRGLLEKRSNVYESQAAAAAIRVQKEQEKIDKERLAIQNAATKEEKEAAQMRLIAAQASKLFAETELRDAQKKLGWTQESLQQANEILAVMELVAGAIDGMKQAAQQLSDMFDALGHEHTANTWSDISDTIGALGSSVSESVNALKSAMNGDVGGAISHTVGIFTSPVTAFAKLHDKKLQRRIEESERKVRSLTTAYQNLQSAMESALGGIYVTGGYDEMFANLQRQRDELAKQYDTESKKKKKDADKLADYEQQISEMDESIKNFALDMAKALYDIDLQGWASQLTEAIVNAWEKGEDAVEAYRSKVKEIMKDLTTNILAKKVMERAFESLGIDDIIAGMMDASSGKLDESMIPKLSEALIKVGDTTAGVITGVLDNLEGRGYIEKDSDSASKSSTSTSIKSITEETADLLASYINAIRADVSVNRMTLTEILYAVQGQSEMPIIARAQLQQLEQVAANTRRNADAAEMIYEVLHANVLGANAFKVK